MDTYQEGMVAIYVCLTVLNLSVIGTAIYYVAKVRRESKSDRMEVRILVESLMEIFDNKYKDNGRDDAGNS